jgi:hypothetical protein
MFGHIGTLLHFIDPSNAYQSLQVHRPTTKSDTDVIRSSAPILRRKNRAVGRRPERETGQHPESPRTAPWEKLPPLHRDQPIVRKISIASLHTPNSRKQKRLSATSSAHFEPENLRRQTDDMTHLEQRVNPSDHAARQRISLPEINTDARDLSASSPARNN